MAYVGGKSKSSSHILDVLNHSIFDDMDYVEPFVGYAHILRRVVNKRSYTASDNNSLLIILLCAIQKGKKLPTISRSRYHKLKADWKLNDTLSLSHAVAAFTYSYCGKEWAGFVNKYTRNGQPHSYAAERMRYYEQLNANPTFQTCKIAKREFSLLHAKGCLIYCDPPYKNTTGYANGRQAFDHAFFWKTVRRWSMDNFVFISEYTAPSDFVCISSQSKYSTLSANRNKRREKLFMKKNSLERLLRYVGNTSFPNSSG